MVEAGAKLSEMVDVSTLEEAAGGDPALMRELAELYVSDGDARVLELESAAVDGDLARAARLAHGLKGSSAAIGARAAAEAFLGVEVLGRDGKGEARVLDAAMARARDAYARTRDALVRWSS